MKTVIQLSVLAALTCAPIALGQPQTPLGPPPTGPAGPPPGPGGPGFGPPGGFGMMGQVTPLVQKFDQDGNGRLDSNERKAAREHITRERMNRPGFGGRGGMRFPGGGQNQTPPQPGERLTPADVPSFPGKPLYDPMTLRTFFLEFESADWEKELADFNNTDVEIPAKLMVDGKTYSDVGVHFRGMTSFAMVPEGRKRPLNLSLDFVHEKQDLDGYNTLNLLNAHEDPSFLRTVLYYEVARAYVPAPKANFVRVVINGENWGIYINAQQFNSDFTKEWFKSKKGARWKVAGSPRGQGGFSYLGDDPELYKQIYHIKTKDDPNDWAAFIRMLKVLNETPPAQLEEKLSPLLDIDGALKFLAVDITLINNDGFWIRASDYNIQRDHTGKFHLIPHDANETFALPGGPGFGRGGFGPSQILTGQIISQADQDNDRKLSKLELTTLATAWFKKLDSSNSGRLSQEQFAQNLTHILPPPPGPPGPGPGPAPTPGAPPPGVPPPGGPGGPGGPNIRVFDPAAIVGPALFAAMDSDKDGSVTALEFNETFAKWADAWDVNKTGSITEDQIRNGLNSVLPPPNPGGRGMAGGPGRQGGPPRPGGPGGRGGPPGMSGPPIEGVKLDPLHIANDPNKPLASKLLAVPELRQRYLQYVRQIALTWLDWDNKLGPIAERYHQLIAADVKRDTRKLHSTEDFEKSLTQDIRGSGGFGPGVRLALKSFADQRRAYLLNHPEIKKLDSSTAEQR